MEINKILLATKNKNKFREINKLNENENLEFIYKEDLIEIEEDGETFFENAYKKAYETAKYYNIISMADDSGLVVEALNNEPGIYSARYAGDERDDEKNNKKVLDKLKKSDNRKAKFVAVIVLARPDGKFWKSKGICKGSITEAPAGENGFGYDPIFKPKNYDKTMAQIEMKKKNKISHRGKAIREIFKIIDKNYSKIFEVIKK